MDQSTREGNNRRLDRRRPPKGRIRVICQRGTMELGRNVGLAVLDLSETGVRLHVSETLNVGQEVSLTLESTASVKPIKRLGRIAWCQATAEGSYMVGISFDKRLDYRQLLELT